MKLCECGCGQPAPVSSKSRPDRGVRRGEPQRFIFGHQASGPGRGPRGESDPRWKGDDAGYHVKHEWLNRHYPRTGRCDQCGAEGRTHYALRHGCEYSRNREDYRELCPSCHGRYDAASRASKLTAELVREIRRLYRPGRPGPGLKEGSLHWLARRYGVSAGCISAIISNRTWRDV